MKRGQSRVEGFDGHWKYSDVLPSHSDGHRIHDEVPQKDAVAIAQRWAANRPPYSVTFGEKQPYLMVTSYNGDRVAVWHARNGAWERSQ